MLRLPVLLTFGVAGASGLAGEAKDVASGVALGFTAQENVAKCIEGAKIKVPIQDLAKAMNYFATKQAADVLNGVREIGAALGELPDALGRCDPPESAPFFTSLQQIMDPNVFDYKVGQYLYVNHHDVFAELNEAEGAYKAKDLKKFGFQVGSALRKLILGVDYRFSEFEVHYSRKYPSLEERSRRMKIFAENYEQVYYIQRSESGTAKYSYLSPFADMTPEEMSSFNGFRYSSTDAASAPLAATLNTNSTPESWDWRAKGAVNPIKNQQQCGSCWAFATVANIEGAGFVETGKLVSLSEQELVDCDKATGDQGCKGGLPSNAYKDMIQKKLGLETESSYPYTATDGQCHAIASKEVASITAWQKISKDEDQIAAAVVKYGPLAIGINAGPMQFYHGGIAQPWKIFCNPASLDHGVAIVGYGVESAKKYWIIRNSWGVTWGEKGYYRIIRGTGACGLNTMVTTATGIKVNSAQGRSVVV